jgi:hypothetical protein
MQTLSHWKEHLGKPDLIGTSSGRKMPDRKKLELFPENGWWARQDSNLGPMDYESTALTAELRARIEGNISTKLTQY